MLSPSLALPLLPGSLPQQGNALLSPSPAPCGYVWEKNWSRVCVTTGRGVSSHSKIPATHLSPNEVHHAASCTSTNPGRGSAPVQRIKLGHHCASPSPAPSSSPPAASAPHHPEPWPWGVWSVSQ